MAINPLYGDNGKKKKGSQNNPSHEEGLGGWGGDVG